MLAVFALAVLAVVAAAAPLLTYSLSLAVFGLAHVAVELRFVESRYGPRLSRSLIRGLAALLVAVVLLRLAAFTALIDPVLRLQLELGVVALLTASVLVDLGLKAGVASRLAVVGGGLIGLGAAVSPVGTMLVLAVLHNWTPIGLVGEAAPASERRRWGAWGLLAFGGIPLLLAAGPLHAMTQGWGLTDLTILPTGALSGHLGVVLPSGWHGFDWAVRLFSAVAFAQCIHYLAVLGVMPRWMRAHPVGPLTAVPAGVFAALVVAGSAVWFAGYLTDFRMARSVYAVFAAVHAWVELPMLVLAARRVGAA